MRVRMSHKFIGYLCGPIKLDVRAHTILNGKWVFGIQPISRACRCIDKVLHFIVSASLKNIEGSHNITLHINFWVLDGVALVSLRSEMNNPVWTAFLEN